MGIFSRLFRVSPQNGQSCVRTWAEKREQELRHSKDLSKQNLIENLFAAMMWSLSRFGNEYTRRSIPAKWKDLGLDSLEHFSGDAALFELGCYMYFRIDIWLFKNKPNHREEISTNFANAFVQLFSQTFNSKYIQALFNQRVSQYGEIIQTGADIKTYHYHLSQLILRTRDNQHPGTYDFETAPVMITGCLERFLVDFGLATWEKTMIPAFIKSVENYCDLTEKQAITASTWVQY